MKTRSRFISGIYNYCDYWCERCEFTRRCRNFSMGREMEAKDAPDDAANSAFWSNLAEKVRETAMFSDEHDAWREFAADADDMDIDPEWIDREKGLRDAVKGHPLMVAAHDYMMRTREWMKGADPDLKALARELLTAAGGRFHDDDYEELALEVGDLLDVVTWYHTLMPPKIGRALHGLLEPAEEQADLDSIIAESRLSDANGSGKLVLMAVDRSIGAWLRLREILPAHEDAILNLLALLSGIQRGVHQAIPGAKSFFRPGFDGEPPVEPAFE